MRSITNNSVALVMKATLLVLLLSGCSKALNTKQSPKQQMATINYEPHQSGALYLAGSIECATLFGLANHKRQVSPIIHVHQALDVDTATKIPAADGQVFLAKTDTLLHVKPLSLWFKFNVEPNKSYKVKIDKTVVEKSLLKQLNYHRYQYGVVVTDELDQQVQAELMTRPNLDPECQHTS